MNLIYKKNCRFCGSGKLAKVINLGYQYFQCYFADGSYNKKKKNTFSTRFLTELVRCNPEKNKNACGLMQLSITIPPKLLYSKYFYKSGINYTMKQHLNNIATEIKNIFKKKKKVYILDIGCNDGTLSILLAIKYFPKLLTALDIDYNLINKAVENIKVILI